MSRSSNAIAFALAVVFVAVACGGGAPIVPTAPSTPASTTSAAPPPTTNADAPLVGHVTRADVEKLPKWIEAKNKPETQPDADAAKALATVPPGASVRVIFGTWCGDSRREVTRFWKALDLAGGKVPFEVEYVAVDTGKKAPAGLVDDVGLRYVPTFVVVRGGKEIGRVIESAPNGIEKDLGALLRGEKTGVLSLRTDVGA